SPLDRVHDPGHAQAVPAPRRLCLGRAENRGSRPHVPGRRLRLLPRGGQDGVPPRRLDHGVSGGGSHEEVRRRARRRPPHDRPGRVAPVLDGRTRPDLQQEEGPRADAAHDPGAVRDQGRTPRVDLPPRRRPGARTRAVPAGLQDVEGPSEGESERPGPHPDDWLDPGDENQRTGRRARGRPRDRRPSGAGRFPMTFNIAGARAAVANPEDVVRTAAKWGSSHGAEMCLLDAQSVFGRDHLESAALHAVRARDSRTMSSRSVAMETLLYAAAARIRTWEPLRDETLNLAPFPCLATAANSGKPPPGKKKFPHERRQSFGHETSYRNGGIRNVHIRIEPAATTPARIKRRMIAK